MITLHHGDQVKCLQGSIDRPHNHAGEIGVVDGFARLSTYHPREAAVTFPDGSMGWFWVSSLEKVEG